MTIRDHIAWIAQDLKIATEECIKKKKKDCVKVNGAYESCIQSSLSRN